MKFLKKFMMPCGLCSATPILKKVSSTDGSPKQCSNETEKKLIRPSELPIYSLDRCAKKIPCDEEKKEQEPSYLEQGFGTIRKNLKGVISQYQLVTETVSNTISTGKEHSEFLVDYLRDDPSPWPRVGAITVGGLIGFLLGIRGGKFKKLIYTSTGALSVAAFCYPEEAYEGMTLAKHYTNIGYNFVYGVVTFIFCVIGLAKPEDENRLEIHWPHIPKSFSEVGDLMIDAGSSATKAVGNMISKVLETVQQKETKSEEETKPKTS